MVNENKALYWVWLTQCFSVSSPKVIELLDKTDPETFYKEKTAYSFLNQNDMRAVTTVSLERAQMILDRCQKLGVQVITMEVASSTAVTGMKIAINLRLLIFFFASVIVSYSFYAVQQ